MRPSCHGRGLHAVTLRHGDVPYCYSRWRLLERGTRKAGATGLVSTARVDGESGRKRQLSLRLRRKPGPERIVTETPDTFYFPRDIA